MFGFALLGLGLYALSRVKPGGAPVLALPAAAARPLASPKPNAAGFFSTDPTHSPSGARAPVAGVQSHPDHHWSYVVRSGDESPGSIAELVLGPEQAWRYIELLVANPHKPIKGSRVSPEPVDDELNFSSLATGEVLAVPRSWNPWIDELGNPSGKLKNFPAPKGGV